MQIKKLSSVCVLAACILLGSQFIFSETRLHSVFSDSMVLQRDIKAAIFGFAADGEKITVEIAGQKKETTAKNGKWKILLEPVKAGGPYTLVITSKDGVITLKDILFGDVWLATGQSNMQTDITYYKNKFSELFKDIPGNYKNDKIRFIRVAQKGSDTPMDDFNRDGKFAGGWRICDEESPLAVSAAGYFFSRKLQTEAGVPVGLIHTCVGGTSVSSWVPMEVLASRAEFKEYIDSYNRSLSNYPAAATKFSNDMKEWNEKKAAGTPDLPKAPQEPMGSSHVKRLSALFNGMINPLAEFRIKGAIWYQGEGDAARYAIYRTLFPAMITFWRKLWGQGDFPFIFVQLASYQKMNENPEDTPWARVREAQTAALLLPNTAMAVAIDAGLEKDIHPPFKQLVGERMAAAALKKFYDKKIVAEGPVFKNLKIEGSKAVIVFDNIGSGLEAKAVKLDSYELAGGELRGFSVCGEDKKFYWAKAQIKDNTVEVSASEVSKPAAVRYAWANFPLCNLYNKEGFPAEPFRTDKDEAAGGPINHLAVGKPFVCSAPNPNNAKGTWGGITDGKLDETPAALFATDSSKTFPKTVTIDLQGAFSLSVIRVYSSKSGATKTVDVQISTDGTDFSSAGKSEFKAGEQSVYEIKNIKTKKITHVRLVFPDIWEKVSSYPGFNMIRELEILDK